MIRSLSLSHCRISTKRLSSCNIKIVSVTCFEVAIAESIPIAYLICVIHHTTSSFSSRSLSSQPLTQRKHHPITMSLLQSTVRSTIAASRRHHHHPINAVAKKVLVVRSFAGAPPPASSDDKPLVKTALNGLHKELGGDMVPFAGYELPVLYKGTDNGGVMKEHLWCRSDGKAGLFDVSHMGQVCSTTVLYFVLLFYPQHHSPVGLDVPSPIHSFFF